MRHARRFMRRDLRLHPALAYCWSMVFPKTGICPGSSPKILLRSRLCVDSLSRSSRNLSLSVHVATMTTGFGICSDDRPATGFSMVGDVGHAAPSRGAAPLTGEVDAASFATIDS